METQIQENRLVSDLSERRLVQYVGAYIALAFGIVQFAMLAEQRYGWSSSLVDKLVLFFVLLLPAVVVFTYNHGKPGADAWKPFEKIFIPANIAVALIGSLLSFNNAAPKTETVTLVDESGVEEQHIVPSQEYSKRISILPYNHADNIGQEESQVLSYLTSLDLEQDSRLTIIDLFELKEELLSYDLDYTKEITQSKALRIAQDRLTDYYITADLEKSDDEIQFSPKVYETLDGKLFFENTFSGESIYNLIDEFTSQLNQKIYPNKDPQFSFVDTPSNEIISSNDEVVNIYIQNRYSTIMNPQISPMVLESMQRAIELDDGCALCYEQLANVQASLNIDGSVETYAKALKHANALPDKTKYRIRYNNYMAKIEIDKAVKVAEKWLTLYPFDIEPYLKLVQYHSMGFRLDDVKETYQKAIDKGHKSLLIRLANLQIANEDLDDALISLKEYKKVFPHKAEDLLQEGDIYIKQGKITEAIEFFENILISDPSNTSASLRTANAYGRNGNFSQEIDILNEALEFAKTPKDSVSILDGFKTNYLRLGDEEKFMNLVKAQNELNKSNFPPMQLIYMNVISNMVNYLNFDNLQHIEELYTKAIGMADSSQKPTFECFRDFNIAFFTADKKKIEKSLAECGDMVKSSLGKGGEHQLNAVIAGMEGDNDAAVESFKLFAEESGGNTKLLWRMVIDYYIAAERYDEAVEILDSVLFSDPENPVAQFYRAKCGYKINQVDQANKYLTKALATWEGASPNYRFYKEATELAREKSL